MVYAILPCSSLEINSLSVTCCDLRKASARSCSTRILLSQSSTGGFGRGAKCGAGDRLVERQQHGIQKKGTNGDPPGLSKPRGRISNRSQGLLLMAEVAQANS